MTLRRDGINVASRFSERCGTTIAAKAVVRVLQKAGIPLAFYDIQTGELGRTIEKFNQPNTFQDWKQLPYEMLLVLDTGDLSLSALDNVEEFATEHRVAGLLYWELEHIPQKWQHGLSKLQPIFAGSSFVQQALFAAGIADAPIIPVVPFDRPNKRTPRSSDQPFTFFANFDLLSSVVRKNPFAVVQAFMNAFGKRSDVRLIVKSWESQRAQLERTPLLQITKDFPSIQFVHDDLDDEGMRTLIDSCDAYVSLHRSEGLGLGMLEAMCSGLPVIATAYSGNTDFLDATCGIPIPYSLIDVAAPDQPYQVEFLGATARWADPDLAAASGAMRDLVANPELYQYLSTNARRQYEKRAADFASLRWLQPYFEVPQRTLRAEGIYAESSAHLSLHH